MPASTSMGGARDDISRVITTMWHRLAEMDAILEALVTRLNSRDSSRRRSRRLELAFGHFAQFVDRHERIMVQITGSDAIGSFRRGIENRPLPASLHDHRVWVAYLHAYALSRRRGSHNNLVLLSIERDVRATAFPELSHNQQDQGSADNQQRQRLLRLRAVLFTLSHDAILERLSLIDRYLANIEIYVPAHVLVRVRCIVRNAGRDNQSLFT